MFKIQDKDGNFKQPALFATKWRIKTVEESNELGTWYNLNVEKVDLVDSKALFDEATLFENINRVTKLIGYNPTGYKTSVLSFNATAGELLPVNIYTIKRFSYFTVNGVDFSFIKDATFSKTNGLTEILTTLSEQNLLYQGKYFDHPVQAAIGEDFETISLIVKDTVNKKAVNIEHDSLNVFVKKFNDNKFIEFIEVDSIFTQDSSTYAYEKRLNENGFYELKFGNSVNGVKLGAGDSVYIYYLKSDGTKGLIASNTLNGNNINIFTSNQFESISKYIYQPGTLFFTPSLATNVSFTNDYGSTKLQSDLFTLFWLLVVQLIADRLFMTLFLRCQFTIKTVLNTSMT